MNTIYSIAVWIYHNIIMILAVAAVIAGTVIKVKKFLKLSKEEQKKLLQEQSDKIIELVKEQLLSLVSKAEKEWGSGTGTIKKSSVWEELLAKYGKLTEYIEEGVIQKDTIDELIDMAVDELNEQKEKNQKVAAAVEKTA